VPQAIGVIGAGAMGMGVVRSLRRAGFTTRVRDLRSAAESEAARLGAQIDASSAALARHCSIAIVLVVDAAQVDDVLFGPAGAAAAFGAGSLVMLSATLPPDYVADLAPRLARHAVALVDAPVSGGPQRAADGTMTIMAAGPDAALAQCESVFAAIAGKVFRVGAHAGDAAKFKIVNNLLAAVNLAAGAEAMALAQRAGLDPNLVVDVVNASSGASWIFADRMPRVLAADFAPRATMRILAKDVGIASAFAARLGIDATFARAADDTFRAAVAAGYGDVDDAAIVQWAALRWPGRAKKS
jgi:putative dehydrogenase